MKDQAIKIICENRKASFDYFLLDRYEAGIALVGTEIKSLRKNSAMIGDSYVYIKDGEAFIMSMNIAKYEQGNIFNHDPMRTRKLLLHKKEILKLKGLVKEKGYTLVPTKVYFLNGRAKLEFAVAQGKKRFDKREDDKISSMEKQARAATRSRDKNYEE